MGSGDFLTISGDRPSSQPTCRIFFDVEARSGRRISTGAIDDRRALQVANDRVLRSTASIGSGVPVVTLKKFSEGVLGRTRNVTASENERMQCGRAVTPRSHPTSRRRKVVFRDTTPRPISTRGRIDDRPERGVDEYRRRHRPRFLTLMNDRFFFAVLRPKAILSLSPCRRRSSSYGPAGWRSGSSFRRTLRE